jgi:hypothetical protein
MLQHVRHDVRRRTVFFFAGFAWSVAAGCATPVRDTALRYDRTLDVPGVEIELSVSPDTISVGGETTLTLVFSNTSDGNVQMSFPERRMMGLLVSEIDQWSADIDDPGDVPGELLPVDSHTIAVPRRLLLRPFETWTHEVSWNGTLDLDGRTMPLDPGSYALVVGTRRSGDDYVNRSRPVSFVVLRSP